MYDTYPITITRDDLIYADACPEGIAAFDDVVPGGILTIADVRAHAALLATPLARFEQWAVEEHLLPPIDVTAGNYGYARAGYWGVSTAGAFGVAVVGRGGTAKVGLGGRAMAAEEGLIEIDWYDGRTCTTAGYIGQDVDWIGSVLEAGTMYAVNSKGRFFRV